MSQAAYSINAHDRHILRELAKHVRELAEGARNQDLRRRWFAHDEGGCERPLILTETDGGIRMVLPDFQPRCREGWAQGLEAMFHDWIMHAEVIRDDYPIEPFAAWQWRVGTSDYGVKVEHTRADAPGGRGAFHIEPPIKDIEKDFARLRPRTFSVDREGTLAWRATLEELFDGVIGVRQRGGYYWTLGMTIVAIDLIGLEQLMLYMYDAPEALHRLMGFLCDDHLAFLGFLEREDLLAPNNENDYTGSGSRGYTRRLPRPARPADAPIRTQDLWCLLESQETVGVGPELFDEFIFTYQERIAWRFGAVYYGCCEPVHTRWHVLARMPNLRRVSVSPWCDEAFMAAACAAGKIVYSRKPNPTWVSTEGFDEAAIRRDLRTTMEQTRRHGCATEIVMKDVHTLHGHPDRLTRWVGLAREVSREVYGD